MHLVGPMPIGNAAIWNVEIELLITRKLSTKIEKLLFFIDIYLFEKHEEQGFGAGTGAALSRGIWLEPEPSLWPGSALNICLIIHAHIRNLTTFYIFSEVNIK